MGDSPSERGAVDPRFVEVCNEAATPAAGRGALGDVFSDPGRWSRKYFTRVFTYELTEKNRVCAARMEDEIHPP